MEIIIIAPLRSPVHRGAKLGKGCHRGGARGGKKKEKKEVKRQQGRDEKSWRESGDDAEGDLLTAAVEQTIINSQ